MELMTERLLLRPWQQSDAESLYEYAANPSVGPIAGWPVHTSVANSRDIIRDVLSADETYAVCLRKDCKAIGSIGLMIGNASNLGLPDTEGEIGYWIGEPFWGRGLIPEAVDKLLCHGFDDLGLEKIWCGYFEGNAKSKRVQEKCGFRFHHTNKDIEWKLMNDIRTEHVSCMTKEDFAVRRAAIMDSCGKTADRTARNKNIMDIAMKQSAIDLGCNPEDFLKSENVIVYSKESTQARKYLNLPFDCDLVTYGNNIVASVKKEYYEIVNSYISAYDAAHCFETPNMHVLNEAFEPFGLKVCFMAEYFLPDMNELKALPCPYEIKILTQDDFKNLYTEQWSNALCEKRKELDVLGVGAYVNGELAGLAACSADCDSMWQIGVDVLPDYRRQGIASALTSRLATLIINRGKVPFYCCAWSNIKSAGNAIKSGFRPAWAEMTVKPKEFVDEMNRPHDIQ